MNKISIPFAQIPHLSDFDQTYTLTPEKFSSFYQHPPYLSSFSEAIKKKDASYAFKRDLLIKVIYNQYDTIDLCNARIKRLIEKLESPNCLTVITAHQPCLFGGPLYVIYKIISAINTAQAVEKEYNRPTIPVFVIGGEDHDFEEINHCYIDGQRYQWNRITKDAVGRLSTEGIQDLIYRVEEQIGHSYYGKEMVSLLRRSYREEYNFSQATQYFLASLFASFPLLVVSMDESEWKKAFIPYMEKEILQQLSYQPVVQQQKELQKIGFSAQAHVREVNFFYFHNKLRDRIVRQENGTFLLAESGKVFQTNEIQTLLRKKPEQFSPNVVMRPIYQEFVFPNVAYVGGGGELAYWMDRKLQFDEFGLSFPVLLRRNSAALLPYHVAKKMNEEYPFDMHDWFGQLEPMRQAFIRTKHAKTFDFSIAFQRVHKLYDDLYTTLSTEDHSLGYSVQAARVKALALIKRLEKKLMQSKKREEQSRLEQLERLYAHLMPESTLQERHEGVLWWWSERGPNLLKVLQSKLKPFSSDLTLLIDP